MTSRVLVVHGPLLERLGQGKLLAEPSLQAVDAALSYSATSGQIELRTARGSTEAELVAAVLGAEGWATHALVSPGALAPTAYVLREALLLLGLPFAEVYVDAMPGAAEHRKRSVLRDAAAVHRSGEAGRVYREALEKLLSVSLPDLGVVGSMPGLELAAPPTPVAAPRPVAPPAEALVPPKGIRPLGARVTVVEPPPPARVTQVDTPVPSPKAPLGKPQPQPAQVGLGGKLPLGKPALGRSASPQPPRGTPAPNPDAFVGLTRKQVRDRIQQQLVGQLPKAELIAWAKDQWLGLESGDPVEPGQRELLLEALQMLAISGAKPMRDAELLSWMARLG
jgi:3-dehydroquinate dehydratase